MFNHAIALTYQPLPKSDKIAIVTNAGGPGVMAADSAVESGLELAKFSPETTEALKKTLPPMANIKNPVDVIGDAREDRYDSALTNISKDSNADGIVCILTPQSMTGIESIAHLVCRVEKEMDKQADLHEKNAQTDMVKDFMGSMLDTPEMKQMVSKVMMDGFKKAK